MGSSGDGTSMVNDAIDTPFAGTHFFDALLENEEYLERYHEYLSMLTEKYVNGGEFDNFFSRVRSQIDTLVAEDPTAFYSADEYETAIDYLYQTVVLRAESINGQIDGTIPSTDAGQRANSSSLVDGSGIDIAAMGEFSMGGGGGMPGGGMTRGGNGEPGDGPGGMPGGGDTSDSNGSGDSNGNSRPDMGDFNPNNMPGDFDPSSMGDFDPSNMPGGFNGGNMPDMGDFDPNNMPEDFVPNNMPEGFDPGSMPAEGKDPLFRAEHRIRDRAGRSPAYF